MLLSEVPLADREQILGGCIAYHLGYGWIQFMSFDGEFVAFKVLTTGKAVVEECRDDLINLRTPKLGYCNVKGHAVYLFRVPKRIMKGGICANNINGYVGYNKPSMISKDQLARFASSFPYEGLHMFTGDYPTYAECVKKIGDGTAYDIAFDRQFSICVNGNAYYCGQHNVGTWDENGIKFLPEHAYLEIMIGDSCGKALQSYKSAPKTRIVGY